MDLKIIERDQGSDIVLEIKKVAMNDRPPLVPGAHCEFLVGLSGRASLATIGSARTFGPADAALVLPEELRALRGTGSGINGSYAKIARLCFSAAWATDDRRARLMEALTSRSTEERFSLVLSVDSFSAFIRKIEVISNDDGNQNDALRGPLAESLFLDLSLELLRDAREKRGESAPHWLRAACDAMGSRKNLRAGGERLTALSGKSKEHVIRQMRRYYGMTPTQYVNELRLRTASRLLVESDRPVLDIGYSLGFQNPSYFAQLFKEKFGMPPTRFRAVRRR